MRQLLLSFITGVPNEMLRLIDIINKASIIIGLLANYNHINLQQ